MRLTKHGRISISIAIAALVIIAGYALVIVRASGFFSGVDPENGTLTANAKVVTDATASGGKAIQFTAPAAPPPPPPTSSGFPDATNTGYKNAPGYTGQLTHFSGTIQSGQTYKFYEFDPGFTVGAVSDVTFFGCRFDGNDASAFTNVEVAGGNNITFDYSSFVPKNLTAPPVAYSQSSQFGLWIHPSNPGKITVDHSDFWGFGNGIQFFPSNDPAKPFTVRNSWFHDARADGGLDHTDGILNGDSTASYVVIDHNTIVSKGNTNGLALQDTADHNVSVTNNYFSGFGYTVRIGGDGNTNVTFTGNTFGTDLKPDWGPLYGWTTGNGNVWNGNKWHVVPGTTWSASSNDGKYWWPDGTLAGTDYTGP